MAYVCFGSVYRNFHDVQEFMEGLEDELDGDKFESPNQLILKPESQSEPSSEDLNH